MITVIITSFTNYGDYTTTLIKSILASEKNLEILVIDNGSSKPYPPRKNYRIHRFSEPVSWSRMLNTGAALASGEWLIILNDDVRCLGKFANFVQSLNPKFFYGAEAKVKPASWFGAPVHYMKLWILVITKALYFEIGGMDEWYENASVDDIDFCWTAHQKGINFRVERFPFKHLETSRRKKWDGFDEQTKKSIAYLKEKVEAAL